MALRPRTTDDGDEGAGAPWKSPSMDEIAAAGRRAGVKVTGAGDDEGDEPADEPEGPAESETEKPEEPEKPAPTADRGRAAKPAPREQPPEEPQSFDAAGRTWTAQDIEELAEREQRLTEALRTQRGETAEMRRATEQLRQSYDGLQKALLKKAGILEGEGAATDEEVQDPAAARQIASLNDTIRKLNERIDGREQEHQEEGQKEVIRGLFDSQFDALSKQAKLEDADLREVIRDLVRAKLVEEDPDLTDPLTGEITERAVRQAVTKAFQREHARLVKRERDTTTRVVRDLREGSRRTAPQPKPAPAKTPAHPHRSPLLRDKEKGVSRSGWDSDEAIGEVIGRVADLGGTGD